MSEEEQKEEVYLPHPHPHPPEHITITIEKGDAAVVFHANKPKLYIPGHNEDDILPPNAVLAAAIETRVLLDKKWIEDLLIWFDKTIAQYANTHGSNTA